MFGPYQATRKETNMSARWKSRQDGTWVVVGSPDEVQPGATVEVVSQSGKTRSVRIEKVGDPFTTDQGETLVYGYPDRRASEKQITALRSIASAKFVEQKEVDTILSPYRSSISSGEISAEDAHRLLDKLFRFERKPDAQVRWRKIDRRWFVLGPPEIIYAGATVRVSKKDGTEAEVRIKEVYGQMLDGVLGIPVRTKRPDGKEEDDETEEEENEDA